VSKHDPRVGLFPPPVVLGIRAVGWPKHEVEAIRQARAAGKPSDEIRSLVKSLVAARAKSDQPCSPMLRLPEVRLLTGLSESTIYAQIGVRRSRRPEKIAARPMGLAPWLLPGA
jgi:predicted DNA-binding transcriptional regulator AlpA